MWFKKNPKSTQIPARSVSCYCGQYERVADVDRLIQIFQESADLAFKSKNHETANTRYELAIEVYHQLKTLGLKRSLRKSTENAMERLVRLFPSQVCMNVALGLCDKAGKAESVNTQLALLKKAQEILEDGLARKDEGHERILGIYSQVVDYVNKAEDLIKQSFLVDGKQTWELAEEKKDDLNAMKACCDAELKTYRKTGNRPAPYYFERVAILSRKEKKYQQEIAYCEKYLEVVDEYYKKNRLPENKGVKMGPRYKAILKRLPKAKELANKENR